MTKLLINILFFIVLLLIELHTTLKGSIYLCIGFILGIFYSILIEINERSKRD